MLSDEACAPMRLCHTQSEMGTDLQQTALASSMPQIALMGLGGAQRPNACERAKQLEPGWAQRSRMRRVRR